jgi:polygalacturonase
MRRPANPAQPLGALILALGLASSPAQPQPTPEPATGDPQPVVTNAPGRFFLNAREFGAKGDGVAIETTALQKALDTCAASGGGVVLLPKGVYITGSIVLHSNTTLQLERGANLCGSSNTNDYPIVRVRWEGEFAQGHRALICATNASHVTISGHGAIFGPPLSLSRLRNPRGPALIEFSDCQDVLLEDFSTQYQQLWSIHLLYCSNLTARGLHIRSINFNGDGLDIDSCQNVLIERCNIDTGDDAISLKSGRGLAAQQLARPTQNVVIKDSVLVSSIYAGIGIGTEMSGGIRNVRIENCTLSGRQNGIFIKSRDGRGGFIEDVTGDNLVFINSATFIGIDLLKKGIQASDPVPGPVEKWARVNNITFSNIRLLNVGDFLAGKDVPAERPLDGLTLTNISGNCARGIILANAKNVKFSALNVSGYEGSFMTTRNVEGIGLEEKTAKQKSN